MTGQKNILWKAREKYHNFCITDIPLLSLAIKERSFEMKIDFQNLQKPYHLQQEPCATGLWLLVQQHSRQREPCYNFYLLH